ncbi:MAG: choice-of-anchor D domain-containing protein, partial [Chloroflexi bacterium]
NFTERNSGSWNNVTFLTESSGTLYFEFKDSANNAHLYNTTDGINFTERNSGSWNNVTFLTESSGTLYFEFKDSANNAHLYNTTDGINYTKRNSGSWNSVQFLTESGGTLYFKFWATSDLEYLYTTTDGITFTERNSGSWYIVSFLTEYSGTLYFSFKDNSTSINYLYSTTDGITFTERLSGSWYDIRFLTENSGKLYFEFEDSSFNAHLYRTTDGINFTEQNNGTWSDVSFLTENSGTLYFSFRDDSYYHNMYTTSDGLNFTNRTNGTWKSMSYITEYDDILYFNFADTSYKKHLYNSRCIGMDILGNSQSISNSDTTPNVADNTDFGTITVGDAPITHTLTISNSGNTSLSLTGSTAVTLTTGTHFTVSVQPSSPVMSNTTTTFDITFNPVATGTFTDTINIANNHPEKSLYTFVISGTSNAVTGPPTVATNAAANVIGTEATLNGTVNANGESTTVIFEYGLTTGYGTTTTAMQSPVTGSTDTAVSKHITGLTPNTTYHYRVVGTNAKGSTIGIDQTFTTPEYVPSTFSIYIPIIVMPSYPDLIVQSVMASSTNVEVVIKNAGSLATVDSFWVDLYINPTTPPTGANQTWETNGGEGIAWGVETTLDPGESLTLTLSSPYYHPSASNFSGTIRSGTTIYAQVDSVGSATEGIVKEFAETNNIFGPIVTTTMATSQNSR